MTKQGSHQPPPDPRRAETVTSETAPVRSGVPERIGRYHIKRVIASGGMGTVYEATQDNPRRVVAVKVMKQGIASKSALRRFEYEGQILGRLRHPGIAQIYEAGTHVIEPRAEYEPRARSERITNRADQGSNDPNRDRNVAPPLVGGADTNCDPGAPGQMVPFSVPYFAMEYIPNAKLITTYADEKKLGTRQRMELFAKVCDAIHHGHQKGIIHRDLKPSNILVAADPAAPPLTKGGRYNAAPLDRGGHGGVVKIIDFGVARCTDSDLAVTTLQTDVGQLIGTLQYMSPEQCEGDPHDIDTRSDVYALGVVFYQLLCGKLPYDVTHMAMHQATRAIRELHPTKLSTMDRTLRGDVETIALKALEKERERRYQSAADFAHDIHRYLNNQVIQARPPSVIYQIRVFARRNKAAFGAIAAVFVVLLVGVIVSTSLYLKAERERGRAVVAEQEQSRERELAEQARIEAEGVTTFLSDMLAAVDPGQSGKDVSVRQVLDQASKSISEKFTNNPLVEARLRSTIGKSYYGLGLYDEAERHLPVAFEMYRRLLGEEHVETIRSMNTLTYLYMHLGREDEALALNERAVEQAHRALGEENAETLTALNLKGNLMVPKGREEELLTLRKYVLEQRRRILGEEHPDTLGAMNNLGLAYLFTGRSSEWTSLCEQITSIQRRVMGDEHPTTLRTMKALAAAYLKDGRSQEAVTLRERALAASRRVLGEEHQTTLGEMTGVAWFYAELDRFAEARALFEQALETYRRVYSERSVLTAQALQFYAHTLLTTGPVERRNQYAEEALGLAERACTLVEKEDGGTMYKYTLDTLALAQHLTGDTKKAIETQLRFLALLPEEDYSRWEYEGRLATYYRAVGRVDDALRMARQRLETLRRLLERGGERPQVLNDYARDLLTIEARDLRDPASALPLAERACALAEERGTYGRWNYLDTLALAQHMTGDTAKAIETQKRALDLLPPEYHQQRKEMEQRLAEYETGPAQRNPKDASTP